MSEILNNLSEELALAAKEVLRLEAALLRERRKKRRAWTVAVLLALMVLLQNHYYVQSVRTIYDKEQVLSSRQLQVIADCKAITDSAAWKALPKIKFENR